MKSRSLLTVIVSMILIGLGILLILANFDIISMEISTVIGKNWPLLLVVVGMKWFIDAFRSNRGGSWTAGSFLAIYASLVVLGNYGVLDFGFGDVWELWPLLLVYIGLHSLLFAKKSKKKGKRVKVTFDSDRGEGQNHKSFVGDHSFSEENWNLEPMDLWTGVGDYYFDFTKAYIPDTNTSIQVRGWVGDIRMLMPQDLEFQVQATANVGDIKVLDQEAAGLRKELSYKTQNYDEATRKLTINLDFQVGDIRIDRV
ncbi:cell wall-active antibiotics response protein LiaF [Salinibacillus xinjiangensis]|uniref:Cell wall-active antibiotics response LiaF-like C-terminal domain-containing protein n=1 Tax=Salinibacillus xinjiangensis TaxID=1229268 RepID=A0A6G1X7F9_9BACI|nr:cell wall-active antibiotics response protein LiaF [Salinibacillus xinjiangensis]MRG86941.1 hypothetical protein [Salinibacillus xinjiangensis]